MGREKKPENIPTVEETKEFQGIDIPKMVSIQEAVELTNIPEYSVRVLIKRGKVKAFRAGEGEHGKWLINLKSLCAYLDNPT